MTHHTDDKPPTTIIAASYPAIPWACPEQVSIRLGYAPTPDELRRMVDSLAAVPYAARPASMADENQTPLWSEP